MAGEHCTEEAAWCAEPVRQGRHRRRQSICISGPRWNDELAGLVRRESLSVVRRRALTVSAKDRENELVHRASEPLTLKQVVWLMILLPAAMVVMITIMTSMPDLESRAGAHRTFSCWHCGLKSLQRDEPSCPRCRQRF